MKEDVILQGSSRILLHDLLAVVLQSCLVIIFKPVLNLTIPNRLAFNMFIPHVFEADINAGLRDATFVCPWGLLLSVLLLITVINGLF